MYTKVLTSPNISEVMHDESKNDTFESDKVDFKVLQIYH